MIIKEILDLDPQKQITILTKNTPESIVTYINQYDGIHEVLNRPDKAVGTGAKARVVTTAKLVLKLQKKIVNSSVYFLTGAGSRLTLTNPDSKTEAAFDYFQNEWDRAKLDTFNKEMVRRLLIETRVAELYYQVPQEGPPKFRYRVKLLCKQNGDEIWPHFDEYGDMDAFSRRYTQTVVAADGAENKIVTFEIYTATKLIIHTSSGAGFITEERINPFGKIPIIYYETDYPDWWDVQGLIDKLEDRVSKFDDTNDYFSSPAVKVKGEIKNAPDKAEVGKFFEIVEGSSGYGDIEYLTWDQTPESMKLEMEMLREYVYSITDTPDLSFDKLKSIGAYSGTAMRFLFLQAIQKSANTNDIISEGLERRINLIRAMLALFDTSKARGLQDMKVTIAFKSPLPVDENELINNLIGSHSEGLISRKTAVQLHPYVEDAAQENSIIDEEIAGGNSFNLLNTGA